jgi:hypothetical protein
VANFRLPHGSQRPPHLFLSHNNKLFDLFILFILFVRLRTRTTPSKAKAKQKQSKHIMSTTEEEIADKELDSSEDVVVAKETPLTYKEKAKANGIQYTVTDVPPLPLALMLGVQHYLTMLGECVCVCVCVCVCAISSLLLPLLCIVSLEISLYDRARVPSPIDGHFFLGRC